MRTPSQPQARLMTEKQAGKFDLNTPILSTGQIRANERVADQVQVNLFGLGRLIAKKQKKVPASHAQKILMAPPRMLFRVYDRTDTTKMASPVHTQWVDLMPTTTWDSVMLTLSYDRLLQEHQLQPDSTGVIRATLENHGGLPIWFDDFSIGELVILQDNAAGG